MQFLNDVLNRMDDLIEFYRVMLEFTVELESVLFLCTYGSFQTFGVYLITIEISCFKIGWLCSVKPGLFIKY